MTYSYTDMMIHLRHIIRYVNLENKRIEKEYGISIPQLLCLNYLNQKVDFKARHSDIKELLRLNASSVTNIIKGLEKKKLVAKLPKSKDRRVSMIIITESGAAIVGQAVRSLQYQMGVTIMPSPKDKLEEIEQAFETVIDFLNIQEVFLSSQVHPGSAASDE